MDNRVRSYGLAEVIEAALSGALRVGHIVHAEPLANTMKSAVRTTGWMPVHSYASIAPGRHAVGHWVSVPAAVRARSFPGRKRTTVPRGRMPVLLEAAPPPAGRGDR
jgi:hypothetical protein